MRKEDQPIKAVLQKVAVQYSKDGFVVAESSFLRNNICGKKPANYQSSKR